MPSISSATLIKERTLELCNKIENWEIKANNFPILAKINEFFPIHRKLFENLAKYSPHFAFIEIYAKF